MAKNDFSSEVAENYEQKCLCVLVLDVSGSMRGKRIDELNKGLQDFYNEISADETTSQRLEVSIITFGSFAKTIQTPKLVENFTMPKLTAEGSTVLVSAVNQAIDLVDERKNWYKSTNQTYYRPWIILMTDGEPDDDQNVDKLSERIKQDTQNKRYAFLPIGVEGANIQFGDTVVVIGIGPVGLMSVAGAAIRGAGRLIAVGHRELTKELAKKYGATDVVDYKDGDIVAQIMELTNNEKVDRVIIAGGTESTINDAYRMVKCGGNISNIAGYDFSKEFHLTVADAGCLVNHVTLTGRLCAGGRYRHHHRLCPDGL